MTFMNFLVTVSRPYDFFPLYFSFLAPSIHTTGSSFWHLLLFRHSFQPFMISFPYTFLFYSQEFTLQARVSDVYHFFVTISFPYDFSSLPGLKNSHTCLIFSLYYFSSLQFPYKFTLLDSLSLVENWNSNSLSLPLKLRPPSEYRRRNQTNTTLS